MSESASFGDVTPSEPVVVVAESGRGPSLAGIAGAFGRIGRIGLVAFAAFGLVAIRNPTSPGQFALAFGLCLVAAGAAVGLNRRLAWAVLYLVAFAVFAFLRALGDETGIPARYDYVITLESALPGALPTIWLQDRFWSPGTSAFDGAMVAVHMSYFFVPHIVALAIWRWRPALVGRYVVAIMACLYSAMIFATLVPTAPPWLAAEAGLIPEVAKVNEWVYGLVNADGYTRDIVHMNPVAAMPSLHFGLTVVALFGLWHFGHTARVLGTVYLALMGLALVYMAEHYVVDLVAGALFAAAAWWAAPPLLRAFQSLVATWKADERNSAAREPR